MAKYSKKQLRDRRHKRIRKKVAGTVAVPRMSVCCTSKHIYIQFIDDVEGRTIVSASTLDSEVKGEKAAKANIEGAVRVAKCATERALAANISKVKFDRGGFKFHGRIKAVADAAREAGLVI